jgi:hypothetical protein
VRPQHSSFSVDDRGTVSHPRWLHAAVHCCIPLLHGKRGKERKRRLHGIWSSKLAHMPRLGGILSRRAQLSILTVYKALPTNSVMTGGLLKRYARYYLGQGTAEVTGRFMLHRISTNKDTATHKSGANINAAFLLPAADSLPPSLELDAVSFVSDVSLEFVLLPFPDAANVSLGTHRYHHVPRVTNSSCCLRALNERIAASSVV